jgi:LAO/AO transport system kinase
MLELAHPAPRLFHHHGRQVSASSQVEKDIPQSLWIPPIQRTVATEGTGVPELGQAISSHYQHLVQTGDWQRRERYRLQSALDGLIEERLITRWRAAIPADRYEAVLQALYQRSISPWQAVTTLIDGEVV